MNRSFNNFNFFFGFALLTTLVLSSCSNQEASPTIVAGHIPDLPSMDINIKIGTQELTARSDAEGKFHMALDIQSPKYISFPALNRSLYLVPGDSMFISEGDPYVFTGGESALINNYYIEKDNYWYTIIDTIDIKWYYSQDPAPFKALIFKVIDDFNNLLDEYAKENPGIGEYFIALEKEYIRHYWYYELNVYYDENKAYTGKIPDLPENFYDYLPKHSLNDTVLFMYEGYRYTLYSWLELVARLEKGGTGNKNAGNQISGDKTESGKKTFSAQAGYNETNNLLNLAEQSFTEPAILKDVAQEILRKQSSRMKVDEKLIARAKDMGLDDWFIKRLENQFENTRSLASGNPAPDFKLTDVDGKIVRLVDFSGKYLVIDVWSHTCGPCIREIPRLEEFKHDLAGKNIEFAGACLSNDEPWKNKMKEIGLPDDGQYRVDKGWGSQFAQNYLKGSGTPSYIIIDPEGKIVTARAPYPSQGLGELLESLPI